MKDLSYLNAFDSKAIRSAKRIIAKGFTVEDLDKYLKDEEKYLGPPIEMDRDAAKSILTKMEKPCCGEGKIDSQVRIFKMKQRKRRGEE